MPKGLKSDLRVKLHTARQQFHPERELYIFVKLTWSWMSGRTTNSISEASQSRCRPSSWRPLWQSPSGRLSSSHRPKYQNQATPGQLSHSWRTKRSSEIAPIDCLSAINDGSCSLWILWQKDDEAALFCRDQRNKQLQYSYKYWTFNSNLWSFKVFFCSLLLIQMWRVTFVKARSCRCHWVRNSCIKRNLSV